MGFISVNVKDNAFSSRLIIQGIDESNDIDSYIECIAEMVKDRFNGNITKQQLLKVAYNAISEFLLSGDVSSFEPNRLLEHILINIFKNIDRYSIFQPAHTAEIIADSMEGNWYGTGLRIASVGNQVIVSKVYPLSSADKVGVSIGDIIIAINGEPVDNLNMTRNYDLLNEKPDDILILDVIKKGSDKIINISMLRQKIINSNVIYRIENSIGYIKIYSFNKHTAECVNEVLDKIDKAGIKKIILDLRHNSGGSLKQAVLVAGKFVPEGLIAKLKFKSCLFEDIEYYSDLKEIKYELAVLVNNETASSSEVLAGAIKDTKSGILVGTRTHGKTAVQKTIPLVTYEAFKKVKSMTNKDIADANELRVKYGIDVSSDELIGSATLTVGEYITPKGGEICKTGIEPDIHIEEDASFRETNKYCIQKLDRILEFALNDECIEIFFAKVILKIAGYDAVAIDDKFDEATKAAILKFQSDKLLQTTGELDLATQEVLNNLIKSIVIQKDLQYAKALQTMDRTDTTAPAIILINKKGDAMELNRKECTPKETIKRIKNILAGIGIATVESTWCSFEGKWHSVRVEIEELPGIGTNGKGITEEFALASAYGELMERIETGVLLKPLFRGDTRRDYYSKDQKVLDINQIDYFQNNVIKHAMDQNTFKSYIRLMEKDNQYRTFVPFFNITHGKTEHLPIKIIEFVAGTNGTCAGNTPYEALVHGICEILERYVHKEIFKSNLRLPTIPLSELKEFSSYSYLETLIKYNYLPIVKDCSLGGKYPVVGVLLLDPSRTRYSFRIASDLDFDIALQRCMTEMFQGIQLNDKFHLKRMMIIECNDSLSDKSDWTATRDIGGIQTCRYKEWVRSLEMGLGKINISIFNNNQDSKYFKKPFIKGEFTNKHAFDYLIKLVSENGYEIYVRNYSYLEFPVYRVYIPGLSECISLNFEEVELLENRDEYVKTFLNMNEGDDRDIERLMTAIEHYKKGATFSSDGVVKCMYPIAFKGADYNKAYDRLIALISYIKLKDFGKAFDALMDQMHFYGSIKNNYQYTFALLIYLKNRKEGVCEDDIKNAISNIYGQEIYRMIENDMEDVDSLYYCFGFPSCPDCSKCAIADNCLYEEWKAIEEKVFKAEMEYDYEQKDLSLLLST